MPDAEELEHVLRAKPPWRRDADLTECGKPLSGRRVLTRPEFAAKVKREGQKRSALTTCMTCWDTASRYSGWDDNPVDVIARECSRIGWTGWQRYGREAPPKAVQLRDELLALAALADAHRDEFEDLMQGIGQTGDLAAVRARKMAERRWRRGTVIHDA